MYDSLSLQAARALEEEVRRTSSRPDRLARHELRLGRRSRRRRRSSR